LTVYASLNATWWLSALWRLTATALVLVSWTVPANLSGDEIPPLRTAAPVTRPVEVSGHRTASVPGEIYVQPSARDQVQPLARSHMRERIHQIWSSRKTLILESPEAQSGPKSLAPIMESLDRQGYGSVVGMEANLVYEAHLLMRQKHLERARQSLEAALALDPRHLPALSAQAEICVRRNPALVPGYLFAALTAVGDSFWPAVTALTNLALLLLFTLLVLSIVFHLVQASRYQKQFRHSINENWRERMPQPLLTVFGWSLLLLPLFLFLGPFWLFSFWTALFWRFARRVERLLAVISLVFFALLIPATDTVVDTFRDLNTGDLHLFSDAIEQKLLSPRAESQLRDAAGEQGPREPLDYVRERQFLVASIQQKLGHDDDAFERYASIPVYSSLYPMAQNNIGNIYFSMNQFDLAIQHYRKAIDIWPGYAECYFNLSSAQFQVYDFDHSDQSLSHAQRLSPRAIGKLITEESRGLKILEHRLPESFLWELSWSALRSNAAQHFSSLGLWSSRRERTAGGLSSLILLAASLATALAGFLIGWISRHEEIRLCNSCGRAYCRLCGPDPLKQEFCQQCIHLGSRMSGVSPEIRKRKMRQIQRHQLWEKFREGLLAITMPGTESLRRGRTIPGSAMTATWIFLIAVLLASPRLLPQIGLRAAPWSLNPLILVVGALAVLLWTLNLLAWLIGNLRRGGWRIMGTVHSGGEES